MKKTPKQSKKITCLLKQKVSSQIRYLLKKHPNTEWSGVGFYKKLNEDKYGWATKWELVAFYPIDLGSGAATEFSGEDQVDLIKKAYKKNPSLKECYKGIIHSHHGLSGGAYFSSVDRDHMKENANKCGYPSLVVAHLETGSPFAFSFSWIDQMNKVHYTAENEGGIEIEYDTYKPSGLFKDCVKSLDKQEKETKNNVVVSNYLHNTYGVQGRLFNNVVSRPKQVVTSVETVANRNDDMIDGYKNDIDDEKYQKLLKEFREADEDFFATKYDDPKYEDKRQLAVQKESELDSYCIEKGYNAEMGWL